MDTAKKTLDSVLGAGTAVLEKARELPAKMHLPQAIVDLPAKFDLPERFTDLQAKVQAVPAKIQERVGEYVTLPQSIKVGPVDLRDLPATLQSYAAKGTERALGLVGETREFLKNIKVAPVTVGTNGTAKAKAPAKKAAAKPRTAKKAAVTPVTTAE